MSTRVPFPKFHNWTLEKYKRELRDAGYYDPWIRPAKRKFTTVDWILCGVAVALLLVAMAGVFVWKEVV